MRGIVTGGIARRDRARGSRHRWSRACRRPDDRPTALLSSRAARGSGAGSAAGHNQRTCVPDDEPGPVVASPAYRATNDQYADPARYE